LAVLPAGTVSILRKPRELRRDGWRESRSKNSWLAPVSGRVAREHELGQHLAALLVPT
jgi:hypothetical protein